MSARTTQSRILTMSHSSLKRPTTTPPSTLSARDKKLSFSISSAFLSMAGPSLAMAASCLARPSSILRVICAVPS